MKKTVLVCLKCYCCVALLFSATSCGDRLRPAEVPDDTSPEDALISEVVSLKGVAMMLADLPVTDAHLQEVYRAVGSSSGNGYDEEYTLRHLLRSPGAGVGEDLPDAVSWSPGAVSWLSGGMSQRADTPELPGGSGGAMRDLIADWLSQKATRSGAGEDFDPERCLRALADSDMQIYWPYSEDWDGRTFPIVTFDPGLGAESNYGYLLGCDGAGQRSLEPVVVDEALAREHPVWVVNRNDDSSFTPVEMYLRSSGTADFETSGDPSRVSGQTDAPDETALPSRASASRTLMLKTFEMKRNYDSWFGGASEFFIKCGTVKGFSARTEAELKYYSPSVNDMMVVVKRRYVGKPVPFDAILFSGFTSQLDKMAFLVTEDDGGTRTTWKCQATVKINSKSYGFDLEIPFNEKDDIVWRGQLPASFFQSEDLVTGRFGDVVITFALE